MDDWDLVDASARQLVGEQLHDGPRTVLGGLAGSERLWDRRIAVVSTHALILRDERALLAWLEVHRLRMPRTMLRYAIERLPPEVRASLMARAG